MDDIYKEAYKAHINLEKPDTKHYTSIDMTKARNEEIDENMNYFKQQGIKFIIVLIIDRNDCYAKIKQAAELRCGILTQCIKSSTLRRMNTMTIGNILLKVNSKLNGMNHQVIERSYQEKVDKKGVMFVGGDVTHPPPDQKDVPSVVGVAASYDQVGFRYNCCWRLQDPADEMIRDFENILVEQLNYYKKNNNKQLPNKIMYYRDGVSDGQFQQVLAIEMTAIWKACARVGPNYKPNVTFIVVQKRHHTRFFPTDRRFTDGRNNNVMPGTVVDKDIVHPHQYQFYLASHAAIQGVTKPTKYCVLYDDSQVSPDDLQAITYDLCHLFTRCNRAVSYVAPTYYAHLVAARGKQYTICYGGINLKKLKMEFDNRRIRDVIINEYPMFFV